MNDSTPVDAALELVRGIASYPDILDGVTPDEDLLLRGLTSGDLIKLALAVEDAAGTPLRPEDMTAIHTLNGIGALISGESSTAV